MTKHKLDQLFKEKLDQIEIEPSEIAFSKLQDKISGRKKPMVWFYMAASLSLVLCLSIWFWVSRSQEVVNIATADLPTEEVTSLAGRTEKVQEESSPSEETIVITEAPEMTASVIVHTTDKSKTAPTSKKGVIPTNPQMATIESPNLAAEEVSELTTEEIRQVENTELILKMENSTIVAEVSQEVETETIERPLPKVKIIYKSGRRRNQTLVAKSIIPSDSSSVKDGAFNRILNSARSLANGSLIADLRDAKENFFNKNDD